MFSDIHASIDRYIHTCIHTNSCLYVYTHICMHTLMNFLDTHTYSCMYVHIYIHIYTQTDTY